MRNRNWRMASVRLRTTCIHCRGEDLHTLPRRRSARLGSNIVSVLSPPASPTSSVHVDPPTDAKRVMSGSTRRTTTEKKRKGARPYADPSLYQHLPQNLIDIVAPDLTLLLVGLNPGVMTAQTGFHFANPTNLFWPLLYSSGIITRPMKASESHSLVAEFDIGITNIVKRPTAEGGELSKQECVEGAGQLELLVHHYRPRAIALTGKGIWDAMFHHLHGRTIRKSDAFQFGWQQETIGSTRIFVTMGTSGRVAAYSPAYKKEVFAQLGAWVREQRLLRAHGSTLEEEHLAADLEEEARCQDVKNHLRIVRDPVATTDNKVKIKQENCGAEKSPYF